MPHSLKPLHLTFEPDFQAPHEIQDLAVACVLTSEEEEEEDETTSVSSCSFTFSYPSTSFSPPSSPVIPASSEEEENPAATLSPPQSPQSSCSFSASCSTSNGVCNSQEQGSSSPQTSKDAEYSPRDPLDESVADLVRYLILKYRLKESVTEAEMVKFVAERYKTQFSVIFRKATKCLEVISGIDLKELNPTTHSYILVNSLDFSHEEMLSNNQSMPKNGLLIIILGVIFMEGNCALEEDIWDFLNIMGVYAGREHFLYGEPRKLITRDWVQENYLEYRQMPNRDPPCYEFLWGPRAHAETSKIKVLEFLAKIKGIDSISFSHWYEKALKDEKEKAQDGVGSVNNTSAVNIA
ncbi:melanoma-associated antigen 10-like [Vulpes vulpes]|uniref:Melanoma-associated antigen 10-like n=1 Tax=Vulpes vulpes TaxID=9627 RepID=A0A3Q7THK1_VULVU